MANNPYVNKVELADGTSVIDISDTTATASDVASGKYFYTAAGQKTEGTASGGGSIVISDTTDAAGGTIRTITATAVSMQSKTGINPTTSSQTIEPDNGYTGLSSVQINAMPTGTAGTPTATKGTVSNHQVSVTPSVTNQTGYITGSTKTGTAVTVSASELVSGSETKTANGTYDVTNLAQLVVNVSGSSGKAVQIASGFGRVASNAYTAVSGQSITVGKTGTYHVYWSGYRSSTSGTSGSQLYIDSTEYGSAQTTFDGTYTNCQVVHLSGVSLTKDQVITVWARSRNSSYYMYVFNLTIIEA